MNTKIDHSTIKNLKKNKPDYLYKNLNNNIDESIADIPHRCRGRLDAKTHFPI